MARLKQDSVVFLADAGLSRSARRGDGEVVYESKPRHWTGKTSVREALQVNPYGPVFFDRPGDGLRTSWGRLWKSASDCFLEDNPTHLLHHGKRSRQAGFSVKPTHCPRFSICLPFIMDKFLLQQQVLEQLAEDLRQVEQAVRVAHETATHEENIAENKYDTLGLEAAYLATGQARRAEGIRQAMANWRQFRPRPYDASKGIQLGALVCLVDSDDKQQQLFLGPDGGSMKLVSGIQVISSEAPLGRAMLGKCEGDEVWIQVASMRQQFDVLRVC